jgi:hypothetical protein
VIFSSVSPFLSTRCLQTTFVSFVHLGCAVCVLILAVCQVNQQHLGNVQQDEIVLLGCLNVSKGTWQVVLSVRNKVDTALVDAPPVTAF